MLLLFILASALGSGLDEIGKIHPSGELPLYMTVTNQGETADYYFEFFTDHSCSENSQLKIEFPEQYPLSLNSPSFSCSLGPCTISNRLLTITLSSPILSSTPYILILFSIKNPQNRGGTGNFALSTWSGNNLIDRNLIFSVLGISASPGSLSSATVKVISGGSKYAGDMAMYQFQFTLSKNLQAWHWLKFTFPSTYNLAAYPSCSAFYVEKSFIPGALNCVATGTQVLMTGISMDLTAGSEYGVYISATNPHYSGTTGTFKIETGRNSTFTVIDRKDNIEGIYISPGLISNVGVNPYNSLWMMTKNKKMLYRVKFLLKNPIDENGYIKLVFSNSFNMDYTSIAQIEYGLDDISRTSPATMTYSTITKELKVYSFAAFTPKLISLLLEINNPSSSGVTNPIKIRSYLSDGTLVDEDTAKALVTISIYSSPTATSVTYPGASGAQATGLSTTIRINFFPQVEVPQLGYITVSIPDGFDITGVPLCSLQPTNMLLQLSPYCNFIDGILTVQLYADTGSNYGKFLSTVESGLEISNILAPETSGWYLFDFNTYSEVWDFLESGQATATMIGSQFVSSNIDVASGGINFPTVLFIDFTTSKVVPTGDIPYISTELQGGIEILFPTMDSSGNLLFPLQLGLGVAVGDTIPCKGISGIDSNLLCVVTYIPNAAANGENIIVIVWNFAEIPSGTSVSIHIAGISYVQTANAPLLTVSTFQKYNRVRGDLETSQITLVAGSVTPAVTASALTLSLSATEVNSTSIISTSGSLSLSASTVSGVPYLLVLISPTHELGYCMYASPICTVGGTTYSCECYSNADVILIQLSANIVAAYTLTISGLMNPESVSTIGDGVIVYLIDNYSVKQYYTFTGTLPLMTAGTIINPKVTVSNRGTGYVNTKYIFQITPEHFMTFGGKLKLTFGSEYGLSISNPPSSCYTKYLLGEVSCTLDGNVITVSGYSANNQLFLLYVTGVKNPVIKVGKPFSCITYTSSSLIIDSQTNIPGVTFEGSWTAKELKYTSLLLTPNNANATADYRIGITPSPYLSAGGVISIIFPTAYFPILPATPVCRLVGHVTTYDTCKTFNNQILIVLDTDPPYKLMYIDIIGLLNFPIGITAEFHVSTSYDGVILQSTTDAVTVMTSTQAGNLMVKMINFYPQNEGEKATYVFEIQPKYNIPVDSLIYIKFPVEFDQRLGESFQCYSVGLNGNLQCSCFSAFTLTVYNHEDYFICQTCSIKLYVYGIVNPTYHAGNPYTGQIHLWVSNGTFINELNEYSGRFKILPAGDYSDIESISHDSLDSRRVGSMKFNMTTAMAIPPTSDNGAIWFTFPSDYPLLTDNFHCTSSDFWAQGVPDCALYKDTIQANEQTEEFYGNLFVNIQNLPYPLTEVLAGYITVKIYDGVNLKLLARTYPNLSPNRLTFTYPGPLIVVNNDLAFTVTAGTMSEFIQITLSYPCALNLTLVPSASGFTFIPSQVALQTGDVLQYFRISVPASTLNGTYYIYWNTLGEIQPPYYVVIIPTTFFVDYTQLKLVLEQPTPVPRGGNSLPILVYLKNSPDSDLTFHFALDQSLTGVSLSQDLMEFVDGEYSQNFTIFVEKNSENVKGNIAVSITGSNVDSYLLVSTVLSFNIFSDADRPEVLAVELTGISRTAANITVTASKICMCYFAFAYRGSGIPSLQEIKLFGPAPYFTTNTNYGTVRVIDYRQGFIFLSGLLKQTSYTLYIWLQDLSGLISKSPTTFDFTTDIRYKTAEVTLYYDQTYLTNSDILSAKSTIALLLSLADWRVIENTSNSKTEPNTGVSPSSQNRRLATIQTYVSFYLLDIENSEVYPRPLEMVTILAGSIGKMSSILSNFYNATEIKGVEVYMEECKFEIYPSVFSVSNTNATVEVSLVNEGMVYAVLTENSTQPYAFQVYLGLDSTNKQLVNNNISASAGEIEFISFTDLLANTTYNVYLICTNEYPGYPDLMNDANLVKLTFTTLQDPVLPSLFISVSQFLCISLLGLILL